MTSATGTEQQLLKQASDRLRTNQQVILRLWADRVRKRLPAAREQEMPVLYDHLPQFLEHLADGLVSSAPGGIRAHVEEISNVHGNLRASIPEYSIKQIILEYVVLYQSIFDVLESDQSVLPPQVRNAILDGINEGILEAVGEFIRNQDQVREQFIAILTHDLKNPLSAAKMSTQMIPRVLDHPDKVGTLAGRALASIKRVEVMIQDLLDTFQIRAGKPLPIDVQPHDLAKVAKEAVEELSTVHGARFVLKTPPSLTANFCRDGITRSIENLGNNAVKYGDPHSPITISVAEEDSGIALSVHNLGNPLIAEEQAKLFQPFHRAPFALTNRIKGWGLGLTLVQGVASAHGGKVTVKSSPQEGTTFTLLLPKDVRQKLAS